MSTQSERRPRWLYRLVGRLLCPHRWEPVSDWFYGSHSCFDIITRTPRRWECRDCGKRIVTRDMPVSYVPPNSDSSLLPIAIQGFCECGAATMAGAYECPCCGRSFEWDQSGVVIAEADKLEELIQLKLENPGMTREAALEWALEMRRLYSPNTKLSNAGPSGPAAEDEPSPGVAL